MEGGGGNSGCCVSAAGPWEGSRAMKRWSEKPRGRVVGMAKKRDKATKTLLASCQLGFRAITVLSFSGKPISHRFPNEIGKEWNNLLIFQEEHSQLHVRYEER